MSENVIQGPWPKSKRKVKVPDEDYVALQEKLNFAEELCQAAVVQMIHTLGENGVDVGENSFIRSTSSSSLLKSIKAFIILIFTSTIDF